MENSDPPCVRDEPGEHRASGRGRDLLDLHFLFANVLYDAIYWFLVFSLFGIGFSLLIFLLSSPSMLLPGIFRLLWH